MKNPFILFAIAVSFLLTSCSVPNAGSSFYQANKRKEGVVNFTLPGWLIYAGTGMAHDFVKDEESRTLLQLAKRVKKMQFMLDEGNGAISQSAVKDFQVHLRNRQFEDLIYVRSEETTVSLMVRPKKDKLRDLIVLVHDDEEFIFLNMRTNIKIKHIAKMLESLMKLDDKHIDEEENPKPVAPPAEKPVARPRA